MKKYSVLLLTVSLCMLTFSVLAEARPMTKYQPGQMIDIGWNKPAVFWAGCEFENGANFMLVDSDFNAGYLEANLDWYHSFYILVNPD